MMIRIGLAATAMATTMTFVAKPRTQALAADQSPNSPEGLLRLKRLWTSTDPAASRRGWKQSENTTKAAHVAAEHMSQSVCLSVCVCAWTLNYACVYLYTKESTNNPRINKHM